MEKHREDATAGDKDTGFGRLSRSDPPRELRPLSARVVVLMIVTYLSLVQVL
jgi:hypothetical protein